MLFTGPLYATLPSLTTLNHVFDRHTVRQPRNSNGARVPVLAQNFPEGSGICTGLRTLYFIDCSIEELKDAREVLKVRRRMRYPLDRLGIVGNSALGQQAYAALSQLMTQLDVEFYDSPGCEPQGCLKMVGARIPHRRAFNGHNDLYSVSCSDGICM
ncbi:hypothetical protein OH77DRAFT_933654 [Trametes cingulata]|nr:hypothetical protein OH77DRAFT_933654 [Trametes cingulata]